MEHRYFQALRTEGRVQSWTRTMPQAGVTLPDSRKKQARGLTGEATAMKFLPTQEKACLGVTCWGDTMVFSPVRAILGPFNDKKIPIHFKE